MHPDPVRYCHRILALMMAKLLIHKLFYKQTFVVESRAFEMGNNSSEE